MFEESYLTEINLDVATRTKKQLWDKVMEIDLKRPLAGFAEMMEIQRCNDALDYWGIMMECHGGI